MVLLFLIGNVQFLVRVLMPWHQDTHSSSFMWPRESNRTSIQTFCAYKSRKIRRRKKKSDDKRSGVFKWCGFGHLFAICVTNEFLKDIRCKTKDSQKFFYFSTYTSWFNKNQRTNGNPKLMVKDKKKAEKQINSKNVDEKKVKIALDQKHSWSSQKGGKMTTINRNSMVAQRTLNNAHARLKKQEKKQTEREIVQKSFVMYGHNELRVENKEKDILVICVRRHEKNI